MLRVDGWRGSLHATAAATTTRVSPRWFDSLLFLALMSGPPKFRGRDTFASLAGAIDQVVLIHLIVWCCGGLWVLARLYPAVVRRGVIPSINSAQAIGALFVGALAVSLWDSPGRLLTAFTVGQFAVMLCFSWVFTHRFGAAACLRHLFIGMTVLALATVAAIFVAPGLVTDETSNVSEGTRVLGNYIAGTGSVAVAGLVFCLSGMPRLRAPIFWGALTLFGALLVAARTRSAYVALIVFLAVAFIYGKGLPIRRVVAPLGALLLSVFLFDVFSSTVDYVVRERESIETMSDRLPLWQHLTSAVMSKAPITGLGYYAASRVVATEYNENLGNAHSVFFEVLVGGGILGAALLVVFCASLLRFAVLLLRVASGQPSAVAAAGLLSVALVMGVTSEVGMHPGPLGFAFWLTSALLPALYGEAVRATGQRHGGGYMRQSRRRVARSVTAGVVRPRGGSGEHYRPYRTTV